MLAATSWRQWNGVMLLLTVAMLYVMNTMPVGSMQTVAEPGVSLGARGEESIESRVASHESIERLARTRPAVPLEVQPAVPPPAENSGSAGGEPNQAAVAPRPSKAAADPYLVIGVATAPKNRGHRDWIRETWMTLPNVVEGSTVAFFLVGLLNGDGTVHDAPMRLGLHAEQSAHGDMQMLNVRETKPPGEKMIGFFRLCVAAYARAKWCVKTDDDTYVHTVRLELNLKLLWERQSEGGKDAPPRAGAGAREQGEPAGPMVYMGATLWASYIESEFAVCGHGMGPMMASGQAKAEKCATRGGVGPFPYVAGTLEVLSAPLAAWIARQTAVARFVQRAHARNPPAWSIGEDTVLGMWVHSSPFAITAIHWGWDKVHDLCFTCKDKTQLWKPITTSSVVVHIKGHQANRHNYLDVHRNFSRVCDAACVQQPLDFDVPTLANLCARGSISTVYSKCAMVS